MSPDAPSFLPARPAWERPADPAEPGEHDWMGVPRMALAIFLTAVGLLAVASMPLVAICFGARAVETQSAFVFSTSVFVACALIVVWLIDGLNERNWRNRAS
jgi:hypothetical protein